MNYKRLMAGLCLAAGILYNSWPLGYVLDNATAHHGLASDLGLAGHPYYWVFILGDILTAVCIIAAVAILRYKFWPALRDVPAAAVTGGLLTFGVFTAASAILSYDTGFDVDVITSTLAALGLFVSLSGLVMIHWKKQPTTLTRFTQTIWAIWTASGLSFAVMALTNGNAHFTQDVLLVTTGAAIIVIGLNLASILPV